MGNLRRYYYANKTKIWRGILIVAFILVIIQVLNYFVGRKNTNKTNTVSNNNKQTLANAKPKQNLGNLPNNNSKLSKKTNVRPNKPKRIKQRNKITNTNLL